jgi:hypothetical protein
MMYEGDGEEVRPKVPLYNRFMYWLSEELYYWARWAEGNALLVGIVEEKRIFERKLWAPGVSDEERVASLRKFLDSHKNDDEFVSALSRGLERGRNAADAARVGVLRAQAQKDIDRLIALDPDKFVAHHDKDDDF